MFREHLSEQLRVPQNGGQSRPARRTVTAIFFCLREVCAICTAFCTTSCSRRADRVWAEGRENASKFCTMLAARRACCMTRSSWRFDVSSDARSCSSSPTPRMAVSGLFSSCAAPAIIWPIAENFSFCANLLFDGLRFGHIPRRCDHSGDVPIFVQPAARHSARRTRQPPSLWRMRSSTCADV